MASQQVTKGKVFERHTVGQHNILKNVFDTHYIFEPGTDRSIFLAMLFTYLLNNKS